MIHGMNAAQQETAQFENQNVDQIQDSSVIALQHDRYVRGREGMQAWAETAKRCTEFVEGKQWSDDDLATMKAEGRPHVTLNKIGTQLRFMLGNFVQNMYEIRFLPGQNGMGIQPIAEALNELSKATDEQVGDKWIQSDLFMNGSTTGRAFIDQRISFDKSDMGHIKEMVLDEYSSIIDPEADTYESKGWNWFQHSRWMSIQQIETLYGPDAGEMMDQSQYGGPISTDENVYSDDVTPGRYFGEDESLIRELGSYGLGGYSPTMSLWDHVNQQRKLIRVIECQHRDFRRGNYVVDLATGDRRRIPEHWEREQIASLVNWARINGKPIDVVSRAQKEIRWTATAGTRVLYDGWSPYRSMTVNGFFPYFRRGKTRGLVEDLLDPQVEINKRRSAFLHILMTAANTMWMYPADTLDEDEKEHLRQHGAKPGFQMEWTPQEHNHKPERIAGQSPPSAIEHAERAALADIKEISGINDAALGEQGNETSGRAVMARQKQAMVGAEPYFHNYSRTRQAVGEKRMELYQDYYTEERVARTLGENGDEIQTAINVILPGGEILNNITVGEYRVIIDEAPMSATFQDAQFTDAMDMVKMGLPVPPDLLVDLSSIPRKDEVKARMQQQQQEENAAAAAGMPPQGASKPQGPGGPPRPKPPEQGGPAPSDGALKRQGPIAAGGQ